MRTINFTANAIETLSSKRTYVGGINPCEGSWSVIYALEDGTFWSEGGHYSYNGDHSCLSQLTAERYEVMKASILADQRGELNGKGLFVKGGKLHDSGDVYTRKHRIETREVSFSYSLENISFLDTPSAFKEAAMPDRAWIENNQVRGSVQLAQEIRNALGQRWESAEFEKKTGSRIRGILPTYIYLFKCTDKVYRVYIEDTIRGSEYLGSVKEINLEAEVADRKAYARKCGWLARKYGNVPFSIALKFGHDEEAYKRYQLEVTAARVTISSMSRQETEEMMHELCCGRARVEGALKYFGITVYGDPKYFSTSDIYSSLEVHLETLPKPQPVVRGRRQVILPEPIAHLSSLGAMCPELANLL